MPGTRAPAADSDYLVEAYQGSQIADVAMRPGIYAWYYVPNAAKDVVAEKALPVLESFVSDRRWADIRVSDQYRVALYGKAELERQPLDKTSSLRESLAMFLSRDIVRERLLSRAFVTAFCRPIYIGITERPLRTRLYDEHYLGLDELWADDSPVSRYLATRESQPKLDEIADELGLRHTFALEARVRGIRPRDLLVHVMYLPSTAMSDFTSTEENTGATLRDLERLLHLLSFPVCGRT